ncbi:MAG: threonine/serine exporter family protein [Bacteroides sp.]
MINFDFFEAIVFDGLFAAVAAVGFAIISNPPRKALAIAALLAAIGHGLRFYLMHSDVFMMEIATASFFAAFAIGLLAIPFAKFIHCPAEVFSFPSLLPMIPGMFAYKTILALTKFLQSSNYTESLEYMVQFFHNGITTVFVLFALVVGAAVPVFIFHRQSFTVTRLLLRADIRRKRKA